MDNPDNNDEHCNLYDALCKFAVKKMKLTRTQSIDWISFEQASQEGLGL